MKLTDVLAAYGALLSTGVFIWNAQRARPNLRVVMTLAIETNDKGIYESGVGISVQNPSAHTVHITAISLLYPFRRVTLMERLAYLLKYRKWPARIGWCHCALSNYAEHGVSDGCPVSIEPGKSHYVFVQQDIVEQVFGDSGSRLLIAEVQDALWRRKYSKPYGVSARKPKN